MFFDEIRIFKYIKEFLNSMLPNTYKFKYYMSEINSKTDFNLFSLFFYNF